MRFENKVTIVTGGAAGIGKATAQGFAKEGSSVIILDISQETARQTVQEIEQQGGKVEAITTDATKTQEVNSAVEKIVGKWGRIDILINNIGWSESVSFLETDEALWSKVLDINLMIALRFCRAVLPHMVKQRYGRVVNIGSVAGREPRPISVVYGAAKAGVISITRSLAVAMAPYNVRVNCVNPCTIETPMARMMLAQNPKHIDMILKNTALERMGKPEEIAAAVLFLASDEASYILGQSLNVDGGNNML